MTDINMFTPTSKTVALACTATSANAILTAPDGYSGNTVDVYNDGPNTAYITFDDSGATAAVPTGTGASAALGVPIPSGGRKTFTIGQGQTYIAGICAATKTATLYVTIGQGF